jgi:hypothetical protein
MLLLKERTLHIGAPDDKEVVLAAVTNNGRALEDASEHLQEDKDTALAAVAQDSRAILFASNYLARGGLYAYMESLVLAWRSFVYFFCAVRYPPQIYTPD